VSLRASPCFAPILTAAIAFAPDGEGLASRAEEAIVKVWDVAPADEVLTMPGQYSDWPGPAVLRSIPPSTGHLAYNTAGHRLALGAQNGNVRLLMWRLAAG
jgi:hypothetical protein